MSDIKAGTDSENSGYQLAENYSSWPNLVHSVAFMKVSLQQRNIADENLKSMPKTLSEAQEALFFICQKPLSKDKDMTKKRFRELGPMKDSKGLIRANGRLSQVDLPEKVIVTSRTSTYSFACYSLLSQITSSRLPSCSCKSFKYWYCYWKRKGTTKSIAKRCMFFRSR